MGWIRARPVIPADLLQTEAYRREPAEAWRRLRHDAPIWHDPLADRWVVSRYDDVLAVLRDATTYGVARPYRRFSEQIGPTLVNLDGPAHRARRAIVAPELVGRRIERIRPRIAARVEGLFAAWPRAGVADARGLLADPLPLLVIADLLGLDEAHHAAFAAHSATILAGLGGDPAAAARGREAHAELTGLFADATADATADGGESADGPVGRSGQPADADDGLIATIVRADVDGQRLTADEVRSFISLLLVAGGETTGLAIANAWAALAAAPDVQAALASDPDDSDFLDAVLAEALRRDGPVIAEDREVRHEVEWHGRTVPAGSTIRALIGSANRDETVFADPDAFDPWRTDLHTGKPSRAGGRDPGGRAGHLTFGAGDHFCLGYQLAHAELSAATTALIRRWPRFTVADPRPVPLVELELMRHVGALRLAPA